MQLKTAQTVQIQTVQQILTVKTLQKYAIKTALTVITDRGKHNDRKKSADSRLSQSKRLI